VKVACVGGGPAGLFFALLMRRAGDHRVDVFERSPADATFGFGVVFSRLSLARLRRVAPDVVGGILEHGAQWGDVEARRDGGRVRSSGHGFAAVERRAMLAVLQRLAAGAGVELHFGTECDAAGLMDRYDLVVAADGANSRTRTAFAGQLGARVTPGASRYAWFASDRVFEDMTFLFAQGPHGPVAAHAYPYSADRSTFLVEMDARSWQRAGFEDGHALPADRTDPQAMAYAADVFADDLAGAQLYGNGSRWLRFPQVRTDRWSYRNLVGIGDAVHTAHFSVGSGTTLALEDAADLVGCVTADAVTGGGPAELAAALTAFEAARRPAVAGVQDAAWASRRIWEHPQAHREVGLDTLMLRMLTRTGQLSLRQLLRMDRGFDAATGGVFSAAPAGPPPVLGTAGEAAGQDAAGGVLVPFAQWRQGAARIPAADGTPVLELPAPSPASSPASSPDDDPYALCADRLRELAALRPGVRAGLLVRPAGTGEQAVGALASAVTAVVRAAGPQVVCVAPGGGDPAGNRTAQMVLCETLRSAGGAEVVYVCPPGEVEYAWTQVQAARADAVWTLPAPAAPAAPVMAGAAPARPAGNA